MVIALGGLIKQSVVKDTVHPKGWDRERTTVFNVQILDSDDFHQVTGIAAPQTPITAEAYVEAGLPFFKLYDDKSSVVGKFQSVKSVHAIDKSLAKRKQERIKEEPSLRPKLIVLNPAGIRLPFRSASELRAELQSLNAAHF